MSVPQPNQASESVPKHIAIVMDGNGRWARKRAMPRKLGHRAGVKAVRASVRGCAARGVGYLTLFAFSSENWERPDDEVSALMKLFVEALHREVDELHENGVKLRFIGDLSRLSQQLRDGMGEAELRTAKNTGLHLQVAVGYGGRWDIINASRALAQKVKAGELQPEEITQAHLAAGLALADCPDPDLMIRTGGEQRISNFLLWNLAYAELYFSDGLWPDFDEAALDAAIAHFSSRQRRYGKVLDQANSNSG